MQIELHRHPGFFGRAASLDVVANGVKITALEAGKSKTISLPAEGAEVKVEMQGAVSSQTLFIGPEMAAQRFECGTPLWVLFDVLDLCYLRPFRNHVFFLRQGKTQA
jgi:hypothetical protein